MERARHRFGRPARHRVRDRAVALLTWVLIAAGLGAIGGIVARAEPAAAARQAFPVARTHVDLLDASRTTPPRGSHGTLPYRYLPTDLYLPDAPGAFPLVVFAAGFNIRTDAYAPMLQEWASAGYVVAAPQFPISGQPGDGPARRDDQVNEPGDISFVISRMQDATGSPGTVVTGRIDAGRVGVAGHSDGGTDAAAIALNDHLIDRRVDAALILSADPPNFPGTAYGPINSAPVLVMSGTSDSIAPLAGSDAIYDNALAPKAQVRLQGGGHLEPFVSDARLTGAAWAVQIDFLDATLRGDPTGRSRLAVDGDIPGVTTVREVGLQPNPIGSLDSVSADPLGRVTASGWTLDPDTAEPITIHVYLDDAFMGAFPASAARPDVGGAYPDLGPDHGFAVTLPRQLTGEHRVCVFGLNVGNGDADVQFGCQVVSVVTNPIGSLDRVTVDPLLHTTAHGWALDPDTTAPITVHTYVDGQRVAVSTADATRPDVGAAFAGLGPTHGFAISLPTLAHGAHVVCSYGINVGSGTANALLGSCSSVFVDHDPFGTIDQVTVGVGGTLRVAGWALDPDATGAIAVHGYVDGVRQAVATTSVSRPDVGAAFPGGGTLHGFDVTMPAPADGQHTVCFYGINTAAGSTNPLLGRCAVVTVSHVPFGSLDAVTGGGGTYLVSGWAIDPDTTTPVDVHVYVDGAKRAAGSASSARPDVGAAFPLYGAAHGYGLNVGALGAGEHVACAYGINTAAGHNELLGCRWFTVP
jgi:predicted dienelactone hydrolase